MKRLLLLITFAGLALSQQAGAESRLIKAISSPVGSAATGFVVPAVGMAIYCCNTEWDAWKSNIQETKEKIAHISIGSVFISVALYCCLFRNNNINQSLRALFWGASLAAGSIGLLGGTVGINLVGATRSTNESTSLARTSAPRLGLAWLAVAACSILPHEESGVFAAHNRALEHVFGT